jgi:hypothetical protein
VTIPKVRASARHRLIVEGRDDQWSIINLTNKHGWDWDNPPSDQRLIQDAGGVVEALKALPVAIKSFDRVGIVLDADIAPTDRWRSVRDHISGTDFTLPDQPDPTGTVRESTDGKRFGVWLMPDNKNPGKLEDFLAILVPPDDPCWKWSAESTEHAHDLGAPFSKPDLIKARIHTWLAWQKEPGQPFGTAIQAATFAHDAKMARLFVAWMERLFA